jgi:hypothetical protein
MNRTEFALHSYSPLPDYREAFELAQAQLGDDNFSRPLHIQLTLVRTVANWHYERGIEYSFYFEAEEQ